MLEFVREDLFVWLFLLNQALNMKKLIQKIF